MAGRTHTYCRICEAACGLQAKRDDHGTLVGLRPDRSHPNSSGFACAKGTRFLEVAQHPDRLLAPIVDGAPASWDVALDRVGDGLRRVVDEHGPHAVGIYFGNPMAFNALGVASIIRFVEQLGSRNVFFSGSQDCNNKFAASRIVHGSPFVHPVPDFEHTDFALVFGSNPYVSQSSFVHLPGGSVGAFDGIQERGGQVVFVDPRRTESAKRWGRHQPIRPGTDAWLLLGLLRQLDAPTDRRDRVEGFDVLHRAARSVDLQTCSDHTGIPRADIVALAGELARARSAALHMSVGVNMGGFGTLAYVLMQAIAYATGNLDARGGSMFVAGTDPISWIARRVGLTAEAHSRVGGFRSTVRSLPAGIMADEVLTDGPERIRALLVIAGDPVRSIPGGGRIEQALKRLDLLACVDMFRSRTAEHADVLMPGSSWLERWDVALPSVPFQTGTLTQVTGPMMPLPGDARHEADIVAELAKRLGLGGAFWSLMRRNPGRWLPSPTYGVRGLAPKPGRYLRRNRVRMWTGEIAAELERLAQRPAPNDDGLRLMSRRRRLGHNSWLHGGRRDGRAEAVAWMHPDDLRTRDLGDGDTIEIRTEVGALAMPVAAHEDVMPGTVVVPHGLHGLSLNDILPSGPEHIERVSGQHVMTGIPVDVRAVG